MAWAQTSIGRRKFVLIEIPESLDFVGTVEAAINADDGAKHTLHLQDLVWDATWVELVSVLLLHPALAHLQCVLPGITGEHQQVIVKQLVDCPLSADAHNRAQLWDSECCQTNKQTTVLY
jgi:hypothetical protein